MMSVSYKSIKASENHGHSNARASPSCDAQMPRLPSVRNKQGLPSQRRARLKKMSRRKMKIMCVQETRWKGNKGKELGDGFKLIYSSANSISGRNGVGIVLDQEMKTKVSNVKCKSVNRISDRVMSLRLEIENLVINIILYYKIKIQSHFTR
ncbi:hypothetical protein M8J77_024065 [Diaphorina citri]|nr:hypothetical protein M8J77_024065 [Diaphorina citri]